MHKLDKILILQTRGLEKTHQNGRIVRAMLRLTTKRHFPNNDGGADTPLRIIIPTFCATTRAKSEQLGLMTIQPFHQTPAIRIPIRLC